MLLQTDRSLARHSWYAETASRRQDHRALQGEVRAEVAIVGGGLAGLSAALELAQRGRQVVLLEAQQLGWAASGRNGGQALGGLACGMDEIEAQLGLADARRLWAMTLEALTLIHARRDRYRIACDWQSGALTVATSARKAAALRRDAERMASVYDHPTQWLDRAALGLHIRSPRYHGGCYDRRGGHLHPLKYALGLADAAWREGARLHEHSPVQRVERHRSVTLLRTPQGQVVADQVLLAGNVHLPALAGVGALPPGTGARIMPVGTYVGVTEPLDPSEMDGLLPTRAAVCDSNFVLDYFRPTADQRLLFGGKVSYSTLTPPNLAGSLQGAPRPGLPASGLAAADPCLGRLRRHHDEPCTRFQPPAPGWGGRCTDLSAAGLLGPRSGAVRAGRQAGGRGDLRGRQPLRPVRAAAAPPLSRRRAPAHPDAGAGHAVAPAARPHRLKTAARPLPSGEPGGRTRLVLAHSMQHLGAPCPTRSEVSKPSASRPITWSRQAQ